LPKTYFTPEAMSCSAKHSPPVPSTILTPSASWACAAGTTDSTTERAAASVRPARVSPVRKARREIECDR